MDLTVYTQTYRCKTADRQREIDECLRRNLNHPGIAKVVLFKEADAPPLPQASVPVEVVESDERITYAEWLRWVKRQGSGIGLLLNADIYLDEGLEHLAATFDTREAFLALTRYNPGHAGFHLNDYPHWTQDVWGVRADAELPESLLYASGFPLGFPGCDNRIAYVMWSHGFRVRNPCYHVRSVHLQAGTARSYDKTSDRLYGGVSYVHPSLAPAEDAELEFTLWTRSEQRPAGVLVNQQAIEQGVHQLRHGEAEVAQRFLDLQQFTGLSWVHEAVGSAHLEGDLHPFTSEDTVFLPMPALLGDGVSLQLRQPARLEGLSLRLPRRAPAGYELELQAEGEGEARLVIEGDSAVALKPGGERRFWQPAELKAQCWARLRLKLVGASGDPAWRAEEGAELVLFGEEGSLSQAKSLNVIAEDTPPSPEPPAQPESKPASPAEPQPGPTAYSWRRRSECTALLEQGEELHRYGSRFRVLRCGDELVFDDRFWPSVGVSPLTELPSELGDRQGLLLWGFGQPTLELRPGFIANTKRFSADVNFWQYPCRTEGDAFAVHQSLVGPQVRDGVLQLYVGLPWATWIDRQSWPTSTLKATADRLRKLRQELGELGLGLKVHSVCQHILWRENLHLIKASGVECLWLSHKPQDKDQLEGVELRAWHLYPVNALEQGRRDTLIIKPMAQRPWLASFIGAHMSHYISDVRLRIKELEHLHRHYIKLNDEWHFYPLVYRLQAPESGGESKETDCKENEIDAGNYNKVMSDTQFSLCPAGAGPNSIRIWEALSAGSIPVVISDYLELPDIKQVSNGRFKQWDEIILFHAEDELDSLTERLESFQLNELQQRSDKAVTLMRLAHGYTCLGTRSDRIPPEPVRDNKIDTSKPTITIPVYGPTDRWYWRTKKHGFYNIVITWYLEDLINIEFGSKGYFWWGKEGEVLLMERDNVSDMNDKKVDPPRWKGFVPYKHAFFFNQYNIKGPRNHRSFYFTYDHPTLERKRSELGRPRYKDRCISSFFAGSVENEVQDYYRSKYAEWTQYIEQYHCTDRLRGNEPHAFSFDQYIELVSRTRYGICIRGNGPKCFREIEYLALGTPLIITSEVEVNFPSPLIEGVHYLKAEHPEDIRRICETTVESEWEAMSKACYKWFEKHATTNALFNYLKTNISILPGGERHQAIKIRTDKKRLLDSLAAISLRIFEPSAAIFSADDNDTYSSILEVDPEDLIISELPFIGRENDYTWRVSGADAQEYLRTIYSSDLDCHKTLLKAIGLKAENFRIEVYRENSKTPISAVDRYSKDQREVVLTTPDESLKYISEFDWVRHCSVPYVDREIITRGPVTSKQVYIEAIITYARGSTRISQDISSKFKDFYAMHGKVIPELSAYRVCKLWEFEECEIISISGFIRDSICDYYIDFTYTKPVYCA